MFSTIVSCVFASSPLAVMPSRNFASKFFIRSQDRLRALPVVIVTTRGDEGSRARALDAGASRFMTKPFTPEQILGEVTALLAPGVAGAT